MLRFVLAGAVLAFVSVFSASIAAATCSDTRVTLRGPNGQAAFTVEIADDDNERAQGLMHRPSMPRFAGMLFDFQVPGQRVFWMENTLIPLDMLFIDETGVVQHIHPQARPLDRTSIFGGNEIRYVLEINGGMAAALGIEVGAEMRHPLVPPETAAWSCE